MSRPVPRPDAMTAPYWRAASDRRFVLPRCGGCGKFHFYPRPLCPHCGSADLAWVEAAGGGTVHAVTVVHQGPTPAFAVPYAVAMVEVDEGPVMLTNIVNCDPASVRAGMKVRVTFLEVEGSNLPVFEPVA